MITVQIGLDAVVTWAVTNSDPANLILLAAVYYKIRQEQTDLRDKIDRIDDRVQDLHNGQSEGD